MKHIDYPYLCLSCRNNIEGYNEKCEFCGQNGNYEPQDGEVVWRGNNFNTITVKEDGES